MLRAPPAAVNRIWRLQGEEGAAPGGRLPGVGRAFRPRPEPWQNADGDPGSAGGSPAHRPRTPPSRFIQRSAARHAGQSASTRAQNRAE